MTDLTTMSIEEMAELVRLMWLELSRRNPIGVNFYEPIFTELHDTLHGIHLAELENPTCEEGPGIDEN